MGMLDTLKQLMEARQADMTAIKTQTKCVIGAFKKRVQYLNCSIGRPKTSVHRHQESVLSLMTETNDVADSHDAQSASPSKKNKNASDSDEPNKIKASDIVKADWFIDPAI